MKIDEAIDAAFHAALILTGSRTAAERAVIAAVDSADPNFTEEALLIETARSAIQQRRKSLDRAELASTLPVELKALALLSPLSRDCFVLRVLIGLGSEVCSEILNLSRYGFEAALRESFLGLPGAIRVTEQMQPVIQ